MKIPENPDVALIAIGDLHANSTVAICPPVVNLDDGGTYHSSKTQKWIWGCYLDFIAEAKIITENYRRVLIVNGDLVELDTHRRSIQLISVNKSTILDIARNVLEPIIDISDASYFIRGTTAHTGKSAWAEEEIAKDTTNSVPQSEDIHSWWHYVGIAGGVKIDVAHHASMSGVPWAKRNAANNLAAKILWQYEVDREAKAPDLVIRGHNHTSSSSSDNYRTVVNYLPSWTTLTEYGYRVGLENALAEIGGIIYLCSNGKFTRHKIVFSPKEGRHLWFRSM